MNRMLIIVMAGLVAAVLVALAVFSTNSGPMEEGVMQNSRLAYLVLAGLYVAAASWAVIRKNPGRMVGHLLVWLGLIALATAAISYFG